MASPIIKLGDAYLVWSSIVDAPITYGMTLDELREHVREEDGRRGLDDLPACLERVEATGTSDLGENDVNDVIRFNRAGASETQLTRDQIVDYYVTRKGVGPEPVGTRCDDDGEDAAS